MNDHVDQILEQWAQECPDLDTRTMALFGHLIRVHDRYGELHAESFREFAIQPGETDVLFTLLRSGAPYQLTAGQLARTTMVTTGAMTNRIDRLESKGLVERVRVDDDRRTISISLTSHGIDLARRAVVTHTRIQRDMLAGMSETERQEFIALTRTLERSLEAFGTRNIGKDHRGGVV